MFDYNYTNRIWKEYREAFGEAVPIFYPYTEEQYINLFKAAEKAIEKGEALTEKQAVEACGYTYDKGDIY